MPTLPYDGIHHIDMHMKLLDEETLLVSEYPDGVADEYYMNDTMQESGLFLRDLKKKDAFQSFNWITNKFKEEQKQINIFGIPQNIGQAKYITNILDEIDNSKNYTDTAVVLADENLLIPVLQSVPETITNINVTMGYPLKNTPINNFFETSDN